MNKVSRLFYFVINFVIGFCAGVVLISIPMRMWRAAPMIDIVLHPGKRDLATSAPAWLVHLYPGLYIIPLIIGIVLGLQGEKIWNKIYGWFVARA